MRPAKVPRAAASAAVLRAREPVGAEHSLRASCAVVIPTGPAEQRDRRFSEFAQRLRDAAATGLSSTRAFWTDVTIEDIRLEGDTSDPDLVILLRTADFPDAVYRLRVKISEYHPEENDPESWAGYIHDQVMEAVDAAPGLPEPEGPLTWVEL